MLTDQVQQPHKPPDSEKQKQYEVKSSRSAVSDPLWPVDCSPPGSSVYGILLARILEWVFYLVLITFYYKQIFVIVEANIQPRRYLWLYALNLEEEGRSLKNDYSNAKKFLCQNIS